MLERCYSEKCKIKLPTYADCSSCSEWLLFSNFRRWMESQDWEGNHLDKDLLVPGNKIYSPEFCMFIPPQLNTLLNNCASARGIYPIGVHIDKRNNVFVAQCKVNGKQKYLGNFTDQEKASKVYREFKSNHIREVAKEYISNTRLYSGLMKHADILCPQNTNQNN